MRGVVKLFSFYGRFNRNEFFTVLFCAFVLVFVAFCIALSVREVAMDAAFVALLMFVGVAKWVVFASAAKRFHDMGYSGWCVLALLIPLVCLVAVGLLLFFPGENDANKYGDPSDFFGIPRTNE